VPTLDDLLSWFGAAAITVAFFRGIRAAREIDRRYQNDPSSAILRTIRTGTWIKVVAAGWFGVITTLGILGYGPFPVLRPVSLLIAIAVLDLPSRYLVMIKQIEGEPVGDLWTPVRAIRRRLRWRR